MNGRLYDAKLHRFLSPDNFVQDPFNTQNFNRYGYVVNNPLMLRDANGEFFWVAFAIGAIYGAVSGGAAYVGTAIRTGDWNFGKFALSVVGGAVIGGLTHGIGGTSFSALANMTIGGAALSGFAAGILPSANFQIGNFGFSISPSIAFGKSFGFGANISASYTEGNFSISGGIGVMAYGNYQGFGKSGAEIRSSLKAAYDDGKTGFSFGSNWFSGTSGMNDFNQRTGSVGFRNGDFSVLYENDGGAGIKNLSLGDKNDSYRTAALNLSYKGYGVGFNLFTGNRSLANQLEEDKVENDKGKMVNPITNDIDRYGRAFKRNFVNETDTPYRLGLLTLGYKNIRAGVNSEHIRHAIQNRVIHGAIGDRGFKNMSWDWAGYSQYKTLNMFSSW